MISDPKRNNFVISYGREICKIESHFRSIRDFGSISVPKTVGEEATKIAIGLGYRHIDCAYIYGNEVQIGQAIRAKIADRTVKREELFYTGKLWCTFFAPELVRKGLEKSLNDLQLDYLDLFILHWPFSLKPTGAERHTDSNKGFVYDNVNFLSTWEALEACKDAGLVKSIGVSNFNHRQLERLLSKSGLKYKPVCNQVECHIYLSQSKLKEYCKTKDIVLVGYSRSLGRPMAVPYPHRPAELISLGWQHVRGRNLGSDFFLPLTAWTPRGRRLLLHPPAGHVGAYAGSTPRAPSFLVTIQISHSGGVAPGPCCCFPSPYL
uniref:NADP-dependent oxidoreductase domain-containing protein n=1 Tax=Leptobrachium leishanense TaxID=445787 RepID=A0A8C5PQW6_9ANUR